MNSARRKQLLKNVAKGLCVEPRRTLLALLGLFLDAIGVACLDASKWLRKKAMEGCETSTAESEEG